MDAPAQRGGARNVRGANDENAILPISKQAPLQPASKNMYTTGIHAQPKRPLGDASNVLVSHTNVPSKGLGKGDFVKPSVITSTVQVSRSLNPAGSKSAVTRAVEVPQATQGGARGVVKKGTTVFKDVADEVVPAPLVQQNLRQVKSHAQFNINPQPALRRTQSVLSSGEGEGGVALAKVNESKSKAEPTANVKVLEHSAETLADEAAEKSRRALPQVPKSEPEEYWEDDEEEVYDEQGYTTAHSYRSRGENTTGGVTTATTLMFPKANGRVQVEVAAAKKIVEAARTQDEIEDEAWDTSMVAEYGDEIFSYMRELELRLLPNAHYMDKQAEIQWSMRAVLMDWLIQVHHRFALLPETLFLCVNYIDRFLSCKVVSLGKLQLVGATAIFVAAKYEEINCPSVSEIVYMVDGGYTTDEILKAERFMLSMLQFELGWPGPMSFLRRISKADDYDLETRTLAKYFLEVTVMDERFVGSPPSFVAAGAHAFARFMLKKGDWSPGHIYYSGYTWSQLKPLVSTMLECCQNAQRHHSAVYEKYSDRRYKRASLFVAGEVARGFVLPSIRYSVPGTEDVDGKPVYNIPTAIINDA